MVINMLYDKKRIIFFALCVSRIMFGAASNEHVRKVTFQSCFKKNTILIPGKRATYWAPYFVSQKKLVERDVRVAAKKHLAPEGMYQSWEIEGYVGFVGGHDYETAMALAHVLSKDIQDQWDCHFIGIISLDDVAAAAVATFNRKYQLRNIKQENVIVSGSSYHNNFALCTVVPESVQKVFEEYDLNPHNLKHIEVFNGFAERFKESHPVTYLQLDQKREHHFLRQENIGKRVGFEHL